MIIRDELTNAAMSPLFWLYSQRTTGYRSSVTLYFYTEQLAIDTFFRAKHQCRLRRNLIF